MYKKPTRSQTVPLKKPPSRSGQSQQPGPTQSSQQRPKYVPPISRDKRNETATKQSQFKSREQHILNMVKEYLSSHGYTRTIETLRRQKPLTKVGLANISNSKRRQSVGSSAGNSQAKNEQQEKSIIKYFERGQRDEFFKNTQKWFNSTDHNAAKLQFELQVYFCTYSVHPSINKSQVIDKPSLEAFKKYLQNRGSQLASEEQYITYFSLPYISKPHENPSFSYLFTKESISKLKQKLVEFIHAHYEQVHNQSKIVNAVSEKEKKCCQLEDIYDSWVEQRTSLGLGEQMQTLNSRARQSKEIRDFKSFKESPEYKEVQEEIRKLKSKLDEANEHRQYALNYVQKLSSNIKQLAESSKANLLESNKKWFLFAKDIIVMVKKASKQQGFKIEGFQKFEGFFGKNIDEVINNADISIFDKQSMMMDDYSIVGDNRSKSKFMFELDMNDRSTAGNGPRARQETSSQLDMVKIQSLFANAEDPDREFQILLLLKALKNRFSKLKNPFGKREVIVEYSRHDVCGVTPQKYYIQKKLLVDGSLKIREFYLRLTNDIAYDLYGIHYLTKSDKLIENLMNVLKQEIMEETACKKFVLAILQRFSYPIKSRRKMVELGIVPLIFKVLQSQQQSPSIYTLQYLTAMIMNLSLKRDCEKHFAPFKQELMGMMIELMCHQSDQIRNYVNGAVYLLLSYKELLQEAKRQHLEQRIQQILSQEMLQNEQQSIKIGDNNAEFSIQQQDQEGMSSMQVQYNYILKKLRGEFEVDEEESDEEEDEGVEIDEFEEEDENGDEEEEDGDEDESEFIDGEDEYITGEELLLKEYTLLGPEALKQQLLTRSVLDETAKKINNTTLSMNRSKRLDNIFVQREKGSQQLILQPQFDKLLGQENMNVSKDDASIKKKR